jgi:hypothetical protein
MTETEELAGHTGTMGEYGITIYGMSVFRNTTMQTHREQAKYPICFV